MKQIGEVQERRMRRAYRPELARFIAARVRSGERTTYQDLADEFGGIARGFGDRLGGVCLHCHDHGYPIPGVMVVSGRSGLPST